jgi:hypothetical protein
MAFPAYALEGSDAVYVGGTISQLKVGGTGSFDFSRGTGLVFQYAGGSFEIPYQQIESYEHSKEVAIHLGVAPAIVVGLIKKRKRNHFVRITFKDGDNLNQVAVFEISYRLPQTLMPILAARAPSARCNPVLECGSFVLPNSKARKIQ